MIAVFLMIGSGRGLARDQGGPQEDKEKGSPEPQFPYL